MPAKPPLLLPVDNYKLTSTDKQNIALELELGFQLPSSKRLSRVSRAVAFNNIKSAKTKSVIMQLYAAASGQRTAHGKTESGRLIVGVAAPQLGVMSRIILVDTRIRSDKKLVGRLVCFINPEIIWRSRETATDREGCFSTGLIKGLVRRPIAIKVKAYNVNGLQIERVYENYSARIIQHEIDHLDGIRFPDRVTSAKQLHWVHDEELESYPKLIKSWKRHCSFDLWDRVKTGKHIT